MCRPDLIAIRVDRLPYLYSRFAVFLIIGRVEIFKLPNHVKWIYRVVGRFSHSIDSAAEELPRNLEELGLGQYEGRDWRGFHHHATLCIGRLSVSILRAASKSLLT